MLLNFIYNIDYISKYLNNNNRLDKIKNKRCFSQNINKKIQL